MRLQGKAAIVTGGGSGFGEGIVRKFVAEGAKVIVADRDAAAAQRVAGATGALALTVDVARADDAKRMVDAAFEHFGALDILVNNAAFQEHAEALEEITDEHFDLTFRTNIYGYFYMTKAALPHLEEGSAIINCGSETGIFGNKILLDYSSTKGAIHAFTKSLATNLAPRGIRVNAVAPGPVWTPLNPADQPETKIADFGSGTSMKRPAQPEEIAPAFVFLASPVCSSYITGIVLPVMGGVIGGTES